MAAEDLSPKNVPVEADAAALAAFCQSLPIAQCATEIVECVRNNFVTIVVGETGSGKSTQLPQYLVDDTKLHDLLLPATANTTPLRVYITQPRRMAAVAMARRVAEERGAEVGHDVGYAIRFDDHSSRDATIIKFVTDGVALREILETGGFSRYQVRPKRKMPLGTTQSRPRAI